MAPDFASGNRWSSDLQDSYSTSCPHHLTIATLWSPQTRQISPPPRRYWRRLFTTLLATPDWTRVDEYGRRVTAWSDSTPPKLEQKVIDFEEVEGLRAGMGPGR
ncbi:hypothetical protein OG21DRAFT_1515268 [Imleria badia]|nr:hypothetical protein OG21DRAFT_1515268 [Imleria badia]